MLPVSAQAHRLLMMKLFGVAGEPALLRLLVHVASLAAVYFACQTHIVKLMRAKSLSRVPKKKRRRPLDTKSLMDMSLWKTMLVPVILSFFFYEKARSLGSSLILVACFLFVNGLILYIPQFLPGSNKDSRSLSRVEGILMGLGGGLSVLPGMSAMGVSVSVGSVCGVERGYAVNMSLLMSLGIHVGLIVFDIMALISGGIGGLTLMGVLQCIVSAAAAFGGVTLGVKLMRSLAQNGGFALFGYYCWGLALFTFILNLMA
ncbi:MAG: undecaprenyl-diphosphate phosphatase [Oscillospiraceae bacterium]|nr:undecaprenyl-diphosphate phosphatase [Oscillospiraceae bacterium]